ncbi:MAG TPA: hypothetical protein PK830_03290 [Candidatus Atribacteria bacterium]|nr:hypothetical protein [Candidatus Atribacteria bacterium]
MEVKPVKTYKKPGYPDKLAVLNEPELLKSVPERWKNNARALFAMSALFALTAAGCGPVPDVTGGEGNDKNPVLKNNPALVAPIFVHGDGRGGFGCVSVAPPVFLSEEEAMDVIRAEAEAAGISLDSGSLTLKGVRIPKTRYYDTTKDTKKGDLELDGYDPDKGIAVEFVSLEDYHNWHVTEFSWASAGSYSFIDAARLLRDGLEGKTQRTTVGVFYDSAPFDMSLWEKDLSFEEMEEELKMQSIENLRKQVRDFIEWLEGEGII